MSRDYTLLAKLGFADADKNPVHNAACRYLAQPSVSLKLCQYSEKTKTPGSFGGATTSLCEAGEFEFARAAVEEPISKGSGQYKTTIGFMDVVLYSKQQAVEIETRRQLPAFGIGIEVKHSQKSIHDAVRQIKLYREYTDNPFGTFKYGHSVYITQWGVKIIDWYLATTFDISQQEIDLLNTSDIRFIKLGEGFNTYIKQSEIPSIPGSGLVL